MPAQQLEVGVPGGEDVRARAGEQLVERGVARRRQQPFEVRARRAVNGEELEPGDAAAHHRGQRGDVGEVVVAELRTGPGHCLGEPAGRLAAPGRQTLEQPAVGVAADGAAAELAQAAEHLARLWPAGGEVAEAHDLVDLARGDVGEDGVEGDAVAVDVADEGEAGHDPSLADSHRSRCRRHRCLGGDFAGREVAVVDHALDDEHG